MCAYWGQAEANIDNIEIHGYDIAPNETLDDFGMLCVKRIHTMYSKTYYDKRTFPDDTENGVLLQHDGGLAVNQKMRIKPLFNNNIMGYLVVDDRALITLIYTPF